MTDPRLDKLGVFLMARFRDHGIDFVDVLLRGGWRSPQLTAMQQRVADLSLEDKGLVRAVAIEAIDGALHDFLFALGEAADSNQGIELRCDGVNAVALSDGLHGEIFGDEGWRARYSRHGEGASEL